MKLVFSTVIIMMLGCTSTFNIKSSDSSDTDGEAVPTSLDEEDPPSGDDGSSEETSTITPPVTTGGDDSATTDAGETEDPCAKPEPVAEECVVDEGPVFSLEADGVPEVTSSSKNVTINPVVENLTEIRFALLTSGSDCAGATYGEWQLASAPITITNDLPGPKTLCMQGRADTVGDEGVEPEIVESQWSWVYKLPFEPNLASLVHLSEDAPLLQMVNDTNDCRSRISDGPNIDTRIGTTSIIDSDIVFNIICNHPSNGWAYARGRWDGVTAAAAWVDANEGSTEFDGHFYKQNLSSNGINKLGNPFAVHLAQLSTNEIMGIYTSSGGGPGPRLNTGNYYLQNPDLATITSTSISVVQNWWFTADAGAWNASLALAQHWIDVGADDHIYVYFTSKDAAGNKYIGVADSTAADFANGANFPDNYLAKDYYMPMVRHIGESYHFVAFHGVRNRWEYIPGTGPATFDWENPVDLGLTALMDIPGKWYSDNYEILTGVKEPRLQGFEVKEIDGVQTGFLFYRAGEHNLNTSTGVRGLGVIRFVFDGN